MNPSYTNGVGNNQPPQNSGQNMPQQPVMPAGGGFGTGGMSSQQPSMSSGTGDIILSGGGANAEKKSRKGVVILIVLVVLLVLVGGGFLLFQNLSRGQTTRSLQEKYNSYVNYVLWGVESDGKPDINAIDEGVMPYAGNLIGDALTDYVGRANVKYAELYNEYEQSTSEEEIDLKPMKVFYEDYARVRLLTGDEILRMYLKDGQDATQKVIEKMYKVSDENTEFSNYLTMAVDFEKLYLKMFVEANAAGCIRNNELLVGCYTVSNEDAQNLTTITNRITNEVGGLSIAASDVLQTLYTQLYGGAESGTAEGETR